MRLGEFRKLIEGLPDDYILDRVMFADVQPGYYDGRPIDYVDNIALYTCEPKIRFHMFDGESLFWNVCEANKSYGENLIEFLAGFKKGDNIEDHRWHEFLKTQKKIFEDCWNNTDWQEYIMTGGDE